MRSFVEGRLFLFCSRALDMLNPALSSYSIGCDLCAINLPVRESRYLYVLVDTSTLELENSFKFKFDGRENCTMSRLNSRCVCFSDIFTGRASIRCKMPISIFRFRIVRPLNFKSSIAVLRASGKIATCASKNMYVEAEKSTGLQADWGEM